METFFLTRFRVTSSNKCVIIICVSCCDIVGCYFYAHIQRSFDGDLSREFIFRSVFAFAPRIAHAHRAGARGRRKICRRLLYGEKESLRREERESANASLGKMRDGKLPSLEDRRFRCCAATATAFGSDRARKVRGGL